MPLAEASTSRTQQGADHATDPRVAGAAPGNNNPWRPLVLSLDGGGIRGLSSLLILKYIMRYIAALEDGWSPGERMTGYTRIAVPCHYFDFMIGTSTGGFIAIMLGRLRMTVQECIDQYLRLGDELFGGQHWWRIPKYDAKILENAIKRIVRRYCTSHEPGSCPGDDLLAQRDRGMNDNATCRTAVLTQKKTDRNVDVCYLLRSYDHTCPARTPSGDLTRLNPGFASTTEIWKAARATSAAPLHFRRVKIDGQLHMDGGLGANNPSVHAFNEARQMTAGQDSEVGALVSLGTGGANSQTRFGSRFRQMISLMKWMKSNITDPNIPHLYMQSFLRSNSPTKYFRFSAQPGLERMELDEWKKRKRPAALSRTQNQSAPIRTPRAAAPRPSTQSSHAPPPLNNSQITYAPTLPLLRNQTASVGPHPISGLDHSKYQYLTLETIQDRTWDYIRRAQASQTEPAVLPYLNACATLLFECARARKLATPDRWRAFVADAQSPLRETALDDAAIGLLDEDYAQAGGLFPAAAPVAAAA